MMAPYTCTAIPGTLNWWPAKLMGATLDFSLDISQAIDPTFDVISRVEASVAPSGSGELVISNLRIACNVLTLTCALGQPSRVYTVMFVVTMFDGRVFEFLVYQGVPPGLPGYPVPVAPAPGFGTEISWPGMVGWAGFPIFGRPAPPSIYLVSPALLGGF